MNDVKFMNRHCPGAVAVAFAKVLGVNKAFLFSGTRHGGELAV